MKENKEIEKILLNDSAFDNMLKKKVENDFKQELINAKASKSVEYITEIKDVPKTKLFTKYATFEVINKTSKTKSYINGVQAEGFLGSNITDRTKLLNGESDSFVCGNSFIKFVKVKISYV